MKKFKQLHHELNVAPLTLSVNFAGYGSRELARLMKARPLPALFLFRGSAMWFFTDEKAWNNAGKGLIDLAGKNPGYFRRMQKTNEVLKRQILKIVQNFDEEKFRRMNGGQASAFIKNLADLAFRFCLYSEAGVISDHNHNTYTKLMEKTVRHAIKKHRSALKLSNAVIALTTPVWPYPSDLAFAEIVKIKQTAKNNKVATRERLKQHLKRWYWLNYGHMGKEPKFSDLAREVKKLNEGQIKKKGLLAKEQRRFTRVLGLDKKAQNLFEVSRIFVYEKGIRLEVCNGVYAVFHKILQRISNEARVQKDDLLYCTAREVADYFKMGKLPMVSELRRRKRASLWVGNHPLHMKVTSGRSVGKYIKQHTLRTSSVLADVSEITGSVAYPGRATGRVKIVNRPSDVAKVREGDILVSLATTPELLPAMKKSAAFITEVGGIASHAAIVAREMKKPCIVGVSLATKVLKDGDRVEVDAMHGVVRKI